MQVVIFAGGAERFGGQLPVDLVRPARPELGFELGQKNFLGLPRSGFRRRGGFRGYITNIFRRKIRINARASKVRASVFCNGCNANNAVIRVITVICVISFLGLKPALAFRIAGARLRLTAFLHPRDDSGDLLTAHAFVSHSLYDCGEVHAIHSETIFAPLERLQGAQASKRFLRSVRAPPSEIGTTWSTSKGPLFEPQYPQVQLSRSPTCTRSAGGRLGRAEAAVFRLSGSLIQACRGRSFSPTISKYESVAAFAFFQRCNERPVILAIAASSSSQIIPSFSLA